MKLRSRLLAGLFLLIWMGGVQALGVGEIELNSHLNQTLAAEIPLIDADGLRADEILVSLGTSEDFERAGVERFFYLTDMRFEVFVDGRGPRIRVTSRRPVTEPYLNFIVEVLWPNGRMLKEFTLLLDPPTYESAVTRAQTETSVVTSAAPPSTPSSATTPSRPEPLDSASAPAAYTRPESAAPPEPPSGGVPTTGRTLWGIAEQYNPDASISVGQYMLAIQRRNPDAFINQNINRMRGGVVLQMPDSVEASEMTASEALREVASQTAAWRGEAETPADSYVSEATDVTEAAEEVAQTPAPQPVQDEPELRAQMDASEPAATSPQEEVAQTGSGGGTGRLEIVGDTGDSGTAQSPAANADVGGLQEENDRLSREIQELGYQSDREKEIAASEIEVKNRQLEVKDQQLAELRQQLEEANTQLADRQGQPSMDQNQPDKPWWQSTAVLALAALIVVLALAGGLLVARRRKAARDVGPAADSTMPMEPLLDPDEPASRAPFARPTAAAGAAVAATGSKADEEAFDFLEDEDRSSTGLTQSDDDAGEGGKASPSLQTSDVISEADIYAAYGRYPHAIGLLLGALEESPDRHDVRLKLLEVAVSANDTETFERHVQELVDRCDDQDILLAARELEETFTGAAIDRTPDAARLAQSTTNDSVEEDLLAGDDDFALDLDDDPIAKTAAKADEDEFLLELDDEHDVTSGLESGPSAEEVSARSVLSNEPYRPVATLDEPDEARSDLLGGDLGLDFDDAELIEERPPQQRAGEDVGSGRGFSASDDLDDDLDIDELLADPDDSDRAQPTPQSRTAQETVQFSRSGADRSDDVPLLDSADAVSEDDLLADDDDGVEDLDELLADLDQAEERSISPLADAQRGGADRSQPSDLSSGQPSGQRSAEILSFSRPKGDGGNEGTRSSVFDDDDSADDDGFDFGTAEDAAETKLDLAQAYIEMGDSDGAADILNEVLTEGNPAQRQLARSLLDSLAS